ncbi:R3H domain-containing protein 1-like [Benincasa hispida]|uniref:R3H domain-containing protein 1-like n=1 Tax=Benincasa hispida TaxID=102211 RepID=UPI001901B703|nr:R3H domain-containing protein 1-like [Benincasa hispida]
MDSSSASSIDGFPDFLKDKVSTVDPFLIEALHNPRHRLTILRMELDIQRFLQNQEQQVFEFQHFPTSYLRLAAHRVAQHYGLQTTVQDNGIDGQGRILVRKTVEARFPTVCLSQIPAKQSADDKPGRVKIAIRPRPNKSSDDAGNCMAKQSLGRSVEQRKEEYDKARARIFSSQGSTGSVDVLSEELDISPNRDRVEECRVNNVEKCTSVKDTGNGASSRVAILRDREKDLSDPDYDRSYERYVKSLPINLTPSMNFAPFTMQNVPPSFSGYHVPRNEFSLSYVSPSVIKTVGLNQVSRYSANAPWPCAGMPYTHTAFQAPLYNQSLSFDYMQYN